MKNKIILATFLLIILTVLVAPSLEAAVSVNIEKAEVTDISEKNVVNGRIVPKKTISIPSKINAEIKKKN